MVLHERESKILALLRSLGPVSRRVLRERTGYRPNTVGDLAAGLIRKGLLNERPSAARQRGRPQAILSIDPSRRHVVGLALGPGRAEGARLNLLGQVQGDIQTEPARAEREFVPAATAVLRRLVGADTLGIGVSVPGFVDLENRCVLAGSALGQTGTLPLGGLFEAAAPTPVVLHNNCHALAARWRLSHGDPAEEDVLLVDFGDGFLGASVLLGGRPNAGCVEGANELGHTRFPVETEPCYCGHTGCLERIFSSPQLRRLDPAAGALEDEARAGAGGEAFRTVSGLLALGLANAVNFIRPGRLVLASDLMRHGGFATALVEGVCGYLLGSLAGRVRFELWEEPVTHAASCAGWLALAKIYGYA